MAEVAQSWVDEFIDFQRTINDTTEENYSATALQLIDFSIIKNGDFQCFAENVNLACHCRPLHIKAICKMVKLVSDLLVKKSNDDSIKDKISDVFFENVFCPLEYYTIDRSRMSQTYYLYKFGIFSAEKIATATSDTLDLMKESIKNTEFQADNMLYVLGLLFYFTDVFKKDFPDLWNKYQDSIAYIKEKHGTAFIRQLFKEYNAIQNGEARFGNEITMILRTDDIDKFQEILTKDGAFDLEIRIPPIILHGSELLQHNPTLILAASFYGAVKCFKYLLLNKAQILKCDEYYNYISHFAVAGGNIEIVRILSQNGINFVDDLAVCVEYHQNEIFDWINQNTVPADLIPEILLSACTHNNVYAFKFYVENGTKIDHPEKYIEEAFTQNYTAIKQYLLELYPNMSQNLIKTCLLNLAKVGMINGVDLIFKNNEYDFSDCADLFIAAVQYNNLPFMKYIKSKPNTNINAKTKRTTPLHEACKLGRNKIVSYMLTIPHIDVNALDIVLKPAMFYAIEFQHVEVLKMLIESPKTRLNKKDFNGLNILMLAAKHGLFYDFFVPIIKNGLIKVNEKTKQGQTLLHWAIEGGNKQLLNLLLDDMADEVDASIANENGYTPLHSACDLNRLDIVEKLLARKDVDVNACERHKSTPLHLVAIKGSVECGELLFRRPEIKVNELDFKERTPLDRAIKNNQLDMIAFLKEHGGIETSDNEHK